MEQITINIENLFKQEREQLMSLIHKANSYPEVWYPNYGENYWCIASHGEINRSSNTQSSLDEQCCEIGNMFKTKEAAQEELERRKVHNKWKRLSIQAYGNNPTWDIDKPHYYATYDMKDKYLFTTANVYSSNIGVTYFPSEDALIHAIAEIGEENVKRYILNIKD